MKKLFRRFLYLILMFLASALGVTFAFKNVQTVSLQYYFGLHWEGSLAMLLLLVWGIGVVTGVLAMLWSQLRLQHQLFRSRQQLNRVQTESRLQSTEVAKIDTHQPVRE